MIEKLRRKLSWIYFISTGIILTGIVSVLFIANINTQKQSEKELFQSAASSVMFLIKNNSIIRQHTLYEFEAANRMLIYIEDNGTAFSFTGAWEPDTSRDRLFEKLQEQTASQMEDPSIMIPVSETVETGETVLVKGTSGDRYYGSVSYIPTQNNTYIKAALLYEINNAAWFSARVIFPYILLEIVGLCALSLLGRLIIKRALLPVEQNMQRQKEFIASASHELKSPLAVIQASSSAIELTPEKTQEFLKIIEQESGRMSHLIQDMLFLASHDSRSWTLTKEPVEPESLLIDVYDTYYPYCMKAKRSLSLELSDDIFAPIEGDKERLLQAFGIFLDNAVSYSKEYTDIILQLAKKEQYCIVKIIDHGIGIPDEEKARVFDRFYRSDGSRTDKKHFGLGLSIAATIIELHNGTIEIQDTRGGGTTFLISFPVHYDH